MKSIKILTTIAIAVIFSTGAFSKSNIEMGNEFAKKNHVQPKFQKVKGEIVFEIYGKDGSFTKQEDTNVWYKMDKTDSMSYLKGVIGQKFSGL